MKSICVFCGSNSGKGTDYLVSAQKLGKLMAGKGIELVYGGGNVGIMGELANTVLQYNGKVTGVIPEDLVAREVAFKDATELKIVKTMHERKALMSELSDGFIMMSGGIGTLEEFFEAWTWAQLGIHSKPIGILNTDNYFGLLIDFINKAVGEKFVHELYLDMIIVDEDPDSLLIKMEEFKPVGVRKWINKEDI
ncbi:MAG TPA: TIGR00730 family Rossman fold protein [Ignavibacteria bacterium]|nr:TIGR00730 family Rossman fold protein [Bacteroidota bacterium]HRI84899.1 TIGR00730 family Rossman fold protein [Ignavibacteria bacterium]HRJ99468.1 TIGR00730 family Rossman fold protein [Ignavibacteria bacterium]HRK00056.1 TIGR00730 family Rossman fold protein [Ignavibacteria bacterium]